MQQERVRNLGMPVGLCHFRREHARLPRPSTSFSARFSVSAPVVEIAWSHEKIRDTVPILLFLPFNASFKRSCATHCYTLAIWHALIFIFHQYATFYPHNLRSRYIFWFSAMTFDFEVKRFFVDKSLLSLNREDLRKKNCLFYFF